MNRETVLTLPVEDLTSHRAPALLVERPLQLVDGGGTVLVSSAHEGLDGLQLLEVAAQGLAVLMGCEIHLRDTDGEPAVGMLVGAKDIRINRAALPGEALVVRSQRTCTIGAMELHDASVSTTDGEELLCGEIKIYSTQVLSGDA